MNCCIKYILNLKINCIALSILFFFLFFNKNISKIINKLNDYYLNSFNKQNDFFNNINYDYLRKLELIKYVIKVQIM